MSVVLLTKQYVTLSIQHGKMAKFKVQVAIVCCVFALYKVAVYHRLNRIKLFVTGLLQVKNQSDFGVRLISPTGNPHIRSSKADKGQT